MLKQFIKQSGYFKYCRDIVFLNKEKCNADRFIGIAFSQGGLQTILKTQPDLIDNDIELFEKKINLFMVTMNFISAFVIVCV